MRISAVWPCRKTVQQSIKRFIVDATLPPPERTCYHHDWQDVTAVRVVSFLVHVAAHHLFDRRRVLAAREVSHAL